MCVRSICRCARRTYAHSMRLGCDLKKKTKKNSLQLSRVALSRSRALSFTQFNFNILLLSALEIARFCNNRGTRKAPLCASSGIGCRGRNVWMGLALILRVYLEHLGHSYRFFLHSRSELKAQYTECPNPRNWRYPLEWLYGWGHQYKTHYCNMSEIFKDFNWQLPYTECLYMCISLYERPIAI